VGQQQLPQKPWYGMEAPSWPPPKINHIAPHFYVIYLTNYQVSLSPRSKPEKCKKIQEYNYQTKSQAVRFIAQLLFADNSIGNYATNCRSSVESSSNNNDVWADGERGRLI
jgi:hypothetical protein